jgi:tRNA(Ile)-lysidine synthetase-like protein
MITFSSHIFNLSNKLHNVDLLCSSGVDSIAAAHHFIHNFKKINVSLLHFNHNLRDQNQAMEESFKSFATSIGICYRIAPLKCSDNTEDACRKARLEYLQQYVNTTFITAHHLDDCVESYLLNCIRGKEGFLPIPFHTELKNNNSINRPFLFSRKKDLIDYAKKHNLLQYVVEDETNSQVKGSRRNLLRNKIVPLLEEEKVGLATIVKKKMIERLKTYINISP